MLILPGRYNNGTRRPRQWGPLSDVQSAVAHNAERIGIDPASILGYWPLWEGAGGKAWDVSLYENHGTLENGPTWENRGLYFDGINNYIETNTSIIPTTGDFTILNRFKTSSSTTGRHVYGQYRSPTPPGRFYAGINVSSSQRFGIFHGGGVGMLESDTDFSLIDWNAVAVRRLGNSIWR